MVICGGDLLYHPAFFVCLRRVSRFQVAALRAVDWWREVITNGMAEVSHYGFLFDRDVVRAASLFPRKRARTTLELGLPEAATDEQIVKVAWEHQLTIVTGNGEDFIREILNHQRGTQIKLCFDMNGLVILPNGFELQKRSLRDVEKRLRFGGKRISWHDVWYKNLCVRVLRNGRVRIATFPKCLYCQKMEQK
jgi:hypothetical protein